MSNRAESYRCWQGLAKPGRCKFCRRRITWQTTDGNKRLPFDAGVPVLRVDVHPETSAKYDVIAGEHLHFRSCTQRPRKTAAGRSAEQGRLL